MENQCNICSAVGGDDLFEKLESGNLRKTCRRCRNAQASQRKRKRKPARFCGCGCVCPLRKGRSLCPACKARNRRERDRTQRRKKTDLRWAGREDELAQLRDTQLNGVGPTKACSGCGVEYPRDQKHFPRAARRNWTYCRECTKKERRARTKRATVHTVQVPPTHQVCSRCFRLLPKTKAFFKPRSDRDALYTRCWSCFSVSNAERTKTRTPGWLSADAWGEITAIYRKARAMKAASGIQYEVDHIEPLNGIDRCGLHVPWNLRIVTREQNFANWRKHVRESS